MALDLDSGIDKTVRLVLKRGAKLFAAFCGVVAALYGLSYVFESMSAGLSSAPLSILALLMQPAIMTRQWLFEIPGAALQYHYYGAMGLLDYVGLVGFYFLLCLAVAWCWTRISSKSSPT